jgi:quinol-cytochrome oxidoreductase complex cytochrome b subunit
VATDAGATHGRVGGWFEERLHASDLFRALLHVRIPVSAQTYFFGGIALFLFGVQLVTGTLLSLYYKPTPEAAYDSVKYITSVVDFGWLIRSIHHWGATLMLVAVILHMLRVFAQAAYKYPRELTWMFGVGLFLATIGFGFTGYLLPWDQKAFWATTVGTEIAGSVPFIGEALLNLLRGGADVTDATLSRFFGMHVLVLPLLFGLLIAIHLAIVHQLGLASRKHADPRPAQPGTIVPPVKEPLKPFFPHYVLDEVLAWAVVLAIIVILASVLPAGLEDKADPLVTPPHVKPEWYFLAVYQLLKIVPRTVGVLAPAAAIGVLLLVPLLDRNREIAPRRRPVALGLAIVMLAGLIVLTIWGEVS